MNLRGPLGQYQDIAHGYFSFPKLEGALGPRMTFRGKECIIWSINSYLGITNHPEVRQADADAAAEYGMAYPMGARIMSGETDAHEQLERELAEFTQKEAALLLNFGYQGIMSIVDACLTRHDVVVYDRDDHACIMDGIRMHQGPKYAFKHNDIDHFLVRMEQAKREAEKRNSGILVITEGVFGMRGEQGILKEICEYKERYGFRLLVDDAHGFGTMGATGAGAGEEQGVQDQIDVYFSTFAKAMSGFGAFVSADQDIIDFFRYNLRSQVFAKSTLYANGEGWPGTPQTPPRATRAARAAVEKRPPPAKRTARSRIRHRQYRSLRDPRIHEGYRVRSRSPDLRHARDLQYLL